MSPSEAIRWNVLPFFSVGLHKDFMVAPIILDVNNHFVHALNVSFMSVHIEDCPNKFPYYIIHFYVATTFSTRHDGQIVVLCTYVPSSRIWLTANEHSHHVWLTMESPKWDGSIEPTTTDKTKHR